MRHAPITPNTRFGALTTIARYHSDTDPSYPVWFCRCDCGQAIVTRASYLQAGRIASCGQCKDRVRVDALRRTAVGTLHLVYGSSPGWQGVQTPIYTGFAWMQNSQGHAAGITPINHDSDPERLGGKLAAAAWEQGLLPMPRPRATTTKGWTRAAARARIAVVEQVTSSAAVALIRQRMYEQSFDIGKG